MKKPDCEIHCKQPHNPVFTIILCLYEQILFQES